MSISIFQQVKDYFFERDLLSRDYIQAECGKHLSRNQLNKHFKMKIKKHDVHKYRMIFNRKCVEELTAFSEATKQGGTFRKTLYSTIMSEHIFEFKTSVKWIKNLEVILNTCWYLGSLYFPWSAYLLFYPGGKRMMKDLFSTPSIEGLLSFYCILYTIQTCKAYDDMFFKEEVVRLIPYINLPEVIINRLGIPSAVEPTKWYQYITLNLVSEQSIKKVASILDAQLVTYVLTELLVYIEDFIKQSGAEQALIEMVQLLNESHTDKARMSPILERSLQESLRSSRSASSRRF